MILLFQRLHLTTLLALLAGMVVLGAPGCKHAGQEVVVYTSVDQPFSEPILRDFERETEIAVRSVFDTEEAKSTGVMNRLPAEKDNAQADVYWANEPIRAEFLKFKGVATPYPSPNAEGIPAAFKDPEHYWTGFSARARVLIIGSKVSPKPNSVTAYLDPRFKGRAAIANPLFGTTTAYAAALFTLWGDEKTKAYGLDGLRAGWILGPRGVIARAGTIHDLLGVNGVAPGERMTLAALRNLAAIRRRARGILGPNLDRVKRFLAREGRLRAHVPPGGNVLFARLPAGLDSERFAHHLLRRYGTLVVPGRFFEAPHFVRIGFGCSPGALTRGLTSLSRALDDFGAATRSKDTP